MGDNAMGGAIVAAPVAVPLLFLAVRTGRLGGGLRGWQPWRSPP